MLLHHARRESRSDAEGDSVCALQIGSERQIGPPFSRLHTALDSLTPAHTNLVESESGLVRD